MNPAITTERLLNAYETLTAFVERESSPEARRRAEAERRDFEGLLDQFKKTVFQVEESLRKRYPQGFAEHPYWFSPRLQRKEILGFFYFDGRHLMGSPNGEPPVKILSLSIVQRLAIARELPGLRRTLNARLRT